MKKILVIALLAVIFTGCGPALFAQGTASQAISESNPASETMVLFDGMLKKALSGYNSGDAKVFFNDFSAKVASLTSDEDFKILYEGMYKKDFGNFSGTELIPNYSSGIYSTSKTAIAGFSGAFEKKSKVLVSSIFAKDEKDWKILSISFHAIDEGKK